MSETESPENKILETGKKALRAILQYLRSMVLVIGIVVTGTITILLWGLAGVLAVLTMVPLILGFGFVML